MKVEVSRILAAGEWGRHTRERNSMSGHLTDLLMVPPTPAFWCSHSNCGWDLWFASEQQIMAKMYISILLATCSFSPTDFVTHLCRHSCSKELQKVNGTWEPPSSFKQLKSANNPCESQRGPFFTQTSTWEGSPTTPGLQPENPDSLSLDCQLRETERSHGALF